MRTLAGILLIGIFSFGCGTKKSDAPHLILTNGKIWTGEDSTSFVEAVAIRHNKIVAVGEAKKIESLKGDSTQVINLEGRLVTAGFNDAHIHFLSGSLGLLEANHLDAKSLDEVIAIVLKFAEENPQKEWITGRGWQYTFFKSGLPDHETMAKLNEIDRPVFLRAYDGHSAWANKKALSLAGVTRATSFSGFGDVVKDKKGEPTGAFKERAASLVGQFVPEPSFQDKLNALRTGMKLAASLGITSIQNANGSEEEIKLFRELMRNKELTLRYAACFSVGEKTSDNELKRFAFLKDSIGTYHPMLQADAVKFLIDGVIESHTASMIEPYSDLPPDSPDAYGKLSMSLDAYRQKVRKADSIGFRIYTHAIGDNGVKETLNAYEQAALQNKTSGRRHRVEHIETIKPEDMVRFQKLGVLPSMEPIHADPATIAVWEKAIGEKRLPYSFAWNHLLQQGLTLVFSSDWPAAISVNPIRGIHVAVNRRTPDGFPENGWVVNQKIKIDQAMKAYTWAGAYSSFEENTKGKVAAGYLADLIVFSDDLFTIPPMDIHKTRVVMTIFDGKVIYEQP